MFTPWQAPQSEALIQLRGAEHVFVRLALSAHEQGGWVARGLMVDVLPKCWLDNPEISEDITGPWWKPAYLFVSERAIILYGFLSGSQVYDWFTEPEHRALADFDPRPGHGSHQVSFDLHNFQETVQEVRHPSYGGWFQVIRYPSTLYTFQPNPYQPSNYDPGPLIGWDSVVGEGKYYRDFRTAQAEMIFGVLDPRHLTNVDDFCAIRVVHAEGWIHEVHVLPDKVVVTVNGTGIRGSGIVVLDGPPEINTQERVIGHDITLPLPEHLPQYTRVVLIRGTGELDEAIFYSASVHYPVRSFPHVIVDREDVFGSQEQPKEAEPSPADSALGDAEPAEAAAPTIQIVPFEVVAGAPAYFQKVVYQINCTYKTDCFDACAVMMRRLLETLIIEAFERNGIHGNIKGKGGAYLPLSGLIGKALAQESWHLSRNTTQFLAKLKSVGDVSAHNPRVNMVRDDIGGIAFDTRVAVEELLYLAKLK
jgi:hypothetical protein